jgi:anti-sigma regulatory factor (Ser/Thr protein kinase)
VAPTRSRGAAQGSAFVHEAFLYAGENEFVGAIAAFARDAITADEPILVMVGARKIELLREELGRDAAWVEFTNMERVGRNPARIIPAWRDFVDGARGRRQRGVGEPIWCGRSADELVESQHHESLLNMAFAAAADMWLVCPYDTDALAPEVIEEARCSHPFVSNDRVGAVAASGAYRDPATAAHTFDGALPDPPDDARQFAFEVADLGSLRAVVYEHAARHGLRSAQVEDLVVAASEVATNSIRHGGGRGTLLMWHDGDAIVCELRDRGRISDPLVGRERPSRQHDGGAGLFLANQFCDLVQVRSSAGGTVVRLRMRRA